MSANRHTVTIGVFTIVAIVSTLAATAAAVASKAVPKTIVGCVFTGGFVSSDGYDIRPRHANGRALDLRPFEGHALTIDGELLPGDAFILNKLPRDLGPCKMARPAGR